MITRRIYKSYTYGYRLLQQKDTIKTSPPTKAHRVESRKDQVQTCSCPLSEVSHGQSLILPATMRDLRTYEKQQCVSTREVHSNLGVQGFCWGACSAHMSELSYSDASTTCGQANDSKPRAFTINLIVSINYLAQHKVSGT